MGGLHACARTIGGFRRLRELPAVQNRQAWWAHEGPNLGALLCEGDFPAFFDAGDAHNVQQLLAFPY